MMNRHTNMPSGKLLPSTHIKHQAKLNVD